MASAEPLHKAVASVGFPYVFRHGQVVVKISDAACINDEWWLFGVEATYRGVPVPMDNEAEVICNPPVQGDVSSVNVMRQWAHELISQIVRQRFLQ